MSIFMIEVTTRLSALLSGVELTTVSDSDCAIRGPPSPLSRPGWGWLRAGEAEWSNLLGPDLEIVLFSSI